MKGVAAHVLAATVIASVGLVGLSVSALAKENPGHHYGRYGNPGHHYGQLKHQTPPSPGSNPATEAATEWLGLAGNWAQPPVQISLTLHVANQAPMRSAREDAGSAGDPAWLILLVLPALLAIWAIAFARIARTVALRPRPEAA